MLKDVVLLVAAPSSAGEALEAGEPALALVAANTQDAIHNGQRGGHADWGLRDGVSMARRTGARPWAIDPPLEATSRGEPRSLPNPTLKVRRQ